MVIEGSPIVNRSALDNNSKYKTNCLSDMVSSGRHGETLDILGKTSPCYRRCRDSEASFPSSKSDLISSARHVSVLGGNLQQR